MIPRSGNFPMSFSEPGKVQTLTQRFFACFYLTIIGWYHLVLCSLNRHFSQQCSCLYHSAIKMHCSSSSTEPDDPSSEYKPQFQVLCTCTPPFTPTGLQSFRDLRVDKTTVGYPKTFTVSVSHCTLQIILDRYNH